MPLIHIARPGRLAFRAQFWTARLGAAVAAMGTVALGFIGMWSSTV
jgi:hypothetical protein